jgi:hypothetical protein
MQRIPAAVATLILLGHALPAQAQGARNDVTIIGPGESCPAGTTEIRPGRCMAPEYPVPSILDYRPESTLVTEEHEVPRARFPAVDFHGHPRGFATPEGLAELGVAMDALNLRVIIAANNVRGDELRSTLAAIEASPMRDRVRVMTGIDFRDVGPGWAERAVAELEADAAAGAVAIGEISKGLGLSATARPTAAGSASTTRI